LKTVDQNFIEKRFYSFGTVIGKIVSYPIAIRWLQTDSIVKIGVSIKKHVKDQLHKQSRKNNWL